MEKIWNKILFPHTAIVSVFSVVSFSLMIYSLVFDGVENIVSYISYGMAFYSLVIVSLRIPQIILFFKRVKHENQLLKRYFEDEHFRIKMSLYLSLFFNIAYAVLQLGLGMKNNSLWFISMSISYVVFALMRFFLLKHTRLYKAREQLLYEHKKSGFCGLMLLLISLAFAINVFFMVYWNKTFYYNEIITITLASFTFVSLTLAIISLIKYRKYSSPVYFSAKMISLIAASISIITLESTMLTTFGEVGQELFRKIILGISGGLVAVLILVIAIMIIYRSRKHIKEIKAERR